MANIDAMIDFSSNGASTDGRKPRKDSKVWMNFVFTVMAPNDKGELVETQVTIAGVGLDTLDPAKVGAKNTPYNQQQAGINAVRKMLVDKALSMEPGSAMILDATKIQTQLRHVGLKEEVSVEADVNPYMISL